MSTTQNIIALESQIPTKVSDLENDAGYITGDSGMQADWNETDQTAMGYIKNKPTIPAAVTIDATLTTHGAAADAKAVGDALAGKLNGAAAYPVWDASRADYLDGEVVSWHGKLWKADEDILDQVGPPDGDGAAYWDETTLDALKQDALSSAQLAAVNSGVTSAKVATWDGYAAQIALKANLTDLPYRQVTLTTPTEWVFSGSGVQSGHAYSIIETNMVVYWNYVLMDNGTQVSSADIGEKQTTVDFSASGDPQVDITATLSGYALLDRAGNRVVVTGDTTLTLPAANPGHLRDFIVRLEISGSTVPTITFAAPTGETIAYETDGDEFPVPDEAGDWLYSFTESCVAHKFAVALKKVNTVAQGGA